MPRPSRPRKVCVIRYLDATGNRVPKGTPGARRVKEQSGTWFAKIGGERVPLGTTDEGEAWATMKRLLREHKDAPAPSEQTFTDHVAAWLADVQAGGASADHVGVLRGHLITLAAEAGWTKLSGITSSSCLQALARLTSDRDLAPRTRNAYLEHARQFVRWCVATERLNRDVLVGVKRVSEEEDQRRTRRRPTEEEIAKLFAWLALPEADLETFRHTFRSGRKHAYRCVMTGRCRALGYRVAMGTGLRAGELRSLTRQSFDLDHATVTLRAAYDKRGKPVTQPLPAWLVDELRAHFAAGGECWAAFPEDVPGLVLQYDLAKAGVAYRTEGPDGPEWLDFHALRHYYISRLCDDPATPIKVIQTLARHSTPSLTLRVYAHARREDIKAAAERLPPPGGQTQK